MIFKDFIRGLLVAGCLLTLASACTSSRTSESTGEYIDSTAITTKVKAAIVDDPMLSVFDIDVETFKSRVMLSGFVESEAQKARATDVARSVEGVKEVENQLVVK